MHIIAVMFGLTDSIAAEAMSDSFVGKAGGRFSETDPLRVFS